MNSIAFAGCCAGAAPSAFFNELEILTELDGGRPGADEIDGSSPRSSTSAAYGCTSTLLAHVAGKMVSRRCRARCHGRGIRLHPDPLAVAFQAVETKKASNFGNLFSAPECGNSPSI